MVLSEIMADPAPSVGLPEYEWVELYNRSSTVVNLAGWRLGDAGNRSGPLPSYELQPGAVVIVAATTAAPHLSGFGECLPVTSWPSLDNAGDLVVLYDNNGEIVHAIHYESSWFENTVKKDGGWTLEMQDPGYPCLGQTNWKESNASIGGSPGIAPVNRSIIPEPPQLLTCYPNAQGLVLRWSHAPDSQSVQPRNFILENGPDIIDAGLVPPLYEEVQLVLNGPLIEGSIYILYVQNVGSCIELPPEQYRIQTGAPELCNPGDVVINEILFNPPPDGYDYLEIYNRSRKIVDGSALRIASRNTSGQLQSTIVLSRLPDLIFPDEYRVYTIDSAWVRRQFQIGRDIKPRQLSSFPSYPDKEGTAVLLNSMNEVVDEVSYSEKWHFALLSSVEGVALERTSADANSNDPSGWHSAAASSGYGTPGYRNSQVTNSRINNSDKQFRIYPRMVSPNNDGIDDRLYIEYKMAQPGAMAGIRIFDASGRAVRLLVSNAVLGSEGQFAWDGLDDQRRPLVPGIYVVWIEWFRLDGKRGVWKDAFVVGGG